MANRRTRIAHALLAATVAFSAAGCGNIGARGTDPSAQILSISPHRQGGPGGLFIMNVADGRTTALGCSFGVAPGQGFGYEVVDPNGEELISVAAVGVEASMAGTASWCAFATSSQVPSSIDGSKIVVLYNGDLADTVLIGAPPDISRAVPLPHACATARGQLAASGGSLNYASQQAVGSMCSPS